MLLCVTARVKLLLVLDVAAEEAMQSVVRMC
jgi:hypothetical protein